MNFSIHLLMVQPFLCFWAGGYSYGNTGPDYFALAGAIAYYRCLLMLLIKKYVPS